MTKRATKKKRGFRPGDLVESEPAHFDGCRQVFLWSEQGSRGKELSGDMVLNEENGVVGIVLAAIDQGNEEQKILVMTMTGIVGWSWDDYFVNLSVQDG